MCFEISASRPGFKWGIDVTYLSQRKLNYATIRSTAINGPPDPYTAKAGCADLYTSLETVRRYNAKLIQQLDFLELAMASGNCACDYISYTTFSSPRRLVNCHCTTCRKQSGAPYQSWAHFATDDIQWKIKPTERRATNTATRSFCPRCGSTISMILDRSPGLTALAAGTLNDGERRIPRPSHHIFLAEKATWYELPDDGAQRWDVWSE